MYIEKKGPERGKLSFETLYQSRILDFRDSRFRCIKVKPRTKEPLEKEWTTQKNYAFNDPKIEDWIRKGGNYGITCPNGDCAFVDADFPEIQKALDDRLPTYWYSTGREGHKQYVYSILDPPIENIPLKNGSYIKGRGGMAVGPGSIHPNGRIYGLEKKYLPIREVTQKELLEVLKDFMVRTAERKQKPIIERKNTAWLSFADLIDLTGFRHFGNQYQGPHPIHGSETGINLSVDLSKNVWHCFRHDSGGSVLEWIAVSEGIIDCADAVPGALRGNKFWQVLEVAHEKYGLDVRTAAKMIRRN